MGWFGKIVGGSIGYVIAGPLGAVAGVALGHSLDDQLDKAQAQAQARYRAAQRADPRLSPLETSQYVYFVTTFSLLAKMAKADGVVTKDEINLVEQFIRRDLGLSQQMRQAAINIFSEAKDSDHSFESFAQQFHQHFRLAPAMLLGMLDMLYRVAMADGVLHPSEEHLLKTAARMLNIPYQADSNLRQAYVKSDDKYYAILGVSREDSFDTIKKRFRTLSGEHHPDKAIAKGMPEEFVQLATKKFQEINEAYEHIKRTHES